MDTAEGAAAGSAGCRRRLRGRPHLARGGAACQTCPLRAAAPPGAGPRNVASEPSCRRHFGGREGAALGTQWRGAATPARGQKTTRPVRGQPGALRHPDPKSRELASQRGSSVGDVAARGGAARGAGTPPQGLLGVVGGVGAGAFLHSAPAVPAARVFCESSVAAPRLAVDSGARAR